MALSRPISKLNLSKVTLSNGFRLFSTTQPMQHGGSIHPWRYSSWVGAVLIGVVGYINILSPNAPHPHRPEFREYEYMRLRGKV